jgi:hypothetical protein
MQTRSRNTTLALIAGLLLAPAAPAAADHRPRAFDVVATISSCGGEGLTIATEISPASGERNAKAAQRGVRAVRRARLRVRFEAAPLYGRTRRTREMDLGRTTTARRFERLGDLPAQTYGGVVRYRWVRGGRTVLKGIAKTRRVRAAGRRGRAFCSLRVGKRPVDTRPPLIIPLPGDSGWKRGPLNVYLWAIDDLSGVALVVSQLDGGSFMRGRNVRIATEGAHRLGYVARDVAGNQSVPATATLRVDMNPPSQPTISTPSGSTSDSTPEVRWAASTDTASGVQSYLALVRNSGGAIVWSKAVRAGDPLTATVDQALAAGQYTAEVVAIDGAAPQPFTAKATSSFSVVGPAAGTADSDADGVADATDNCAFDANADQADLDTDGAGDPCDTDDDADGAADTSDNCAAIANTNQSNLDGDAQGDACDTDDDGDTVADTGDNCPATPNANQANFDADPQGDACDSDDDADGLPDAQDPNDASDDSDGDGFKDGTDPCPGQAESGIDLEPEGCP